MKKATATSKAPTAIGTYSQAICSQETIYISGQIPLNPHSMEIVAGDISEERIEQIHDLIKEQAINTANYNSSLLKLEREKEKLNAKSEQ